MDFKVSDLVHDIAEIRRSSPVVLNLTNLVAMDLTANALLAVGASPLMIQAPEELEEMVALSQAVLINIGTLDVDFITLAESAIEFSQKYHKPVVLDPVGAGASAFRTRSAQKLVQTGGVRVLRANPSEAGSVMGLSVSTKGVDSGVSVERIAELLKEELRKSPLSALAVSGPVDYIFSNLPQDARIFRVSHGHPWMAQVTAMGCALGSLVGAFLSVQPNAQMAALHAHIAMGKAGENSAKNSTGPGSFRAAFLDSLSQLEQNDWSELRVSTL